MVALALKERQRLHGEAANEAVTTAFFLADHASRLFEASDFLLKEVADEVGGLAWTNIDASRHVWERLQGLADRLPYVDAIWLQDEAGNIRLGTSQFPTPRVNVADRDFFRAHLEPGAGLFVSGAIVGRVTGKPTFLMSRRLNTPDGSLRGVVAVTADLNYFREFYGTLNLPYQPAVTLFRAEDMRPLASHPPQGNEGSPGRPPSVPPLAEVIARAPVQGFVPDLETDRGRMAAAYRKAGALPVYVGVQIAEAHLDKVWRGQVNIYGFLGGTALLALSVLTLFAFRQARRVAEAQKELERRVIARTADLAAANTEMETLFQEVHHRVKNNLQVVTSLLRLQQMRVESPQARAALRDSIERIHAMGLVHQLLYSKHELSHVDFGIYTDSLVRQLVEAYGMTDRVQVAIGGDPVRYDLDTTIPLALIVNEVVSNALKHAFPEDRRGRITITFRHDGDEDELAIQDDGVSMPPGLDWTRTSGLGLRIVRTLSAQIDGVADFTSEAGTRFTLRFPRSGRRPSDDEPPH
jgi:two-component system, sensor histidine kinase PdtaS